MLRPRWALVPRRKGEAEADGEDDASVDWLAMAPFGFKLPWGTTAHEPAPADLPIGALSAERAAALEARAAAKAEKAAAAAAAAEAKAAAKAEKAAEKAAEAEAKAAAKEEKAAARAAAQAEAEAAKAERAAAALPWRCVLAMRAGKKSRDDIVAFLQADGQPAADRGHIVTVLGKEPKMPEPRWTQSGEAYKLTKHGKSYTPFADGVAPRRRRRRRRRSGRRPRTSSRCRRRRRRRSRGGGEEAGGGEEGAGEGGVGRRQEAAAAGGGRDEGVVRADDVSKM